MNARMGPEDVQYTYNTTTNNNGNRLKEIMEEYQLLAANSQFQKKKKVSYGLGFHHIRQNIKLTIS